MTRAERHNEYRGILLGKHFNKFDLTYEHTQHENIPNEEHLSNLTKLATNIFDPLADRYGKTNILILNAFRSKETQDQVCKKNERVRLYRGFHETGKAADFRLAGSELTVKAFHYIWNELKFFEMTWVLGDMRCPQHIHIVYDEGNNLKRVYSLTISVPNKHGNHLVKAFMGQHVRKRGPNY